MEGLNKTNKSLFASNYEVKINLIENWDNHLNNRMLKMGYEAEKGGYTSLDYHKAMKKLISVHPREVFYSREFSYQDKYQPALTQLILDIESGKNLIPYMSKQVKNPAFNDDMLNNWGIHHFHLNIDKEEKTEFIERSDWLLLAFVNEKAAYLLNVYPHKKPYLWTHIKLIEIIHNNWPELIEENRLDEVVSLGEKLDDKSYRKVRRNNANTLLELGENQVYGLIGGGYSSDGSSIKALRISDYWHNCMMEIESFIHDEYLNFKRQMLTFDSNSMDKTLEVELMTVTEEEIILLEKQRNIIIKVNYNNQDIKMLDIEYAMYGFPGEFYRRWYWILEHLR